MHPIIEAWRLPKAWKGYLFALAFFLLTFGEATVDPTIATHLTWLPQLVYLAGIGYWLYCVYAIHSVVGKALNGKYPVSPWQAVLNHLVPFYNLYWLLKWPNELADFVNALRERRALAKWWPGAVLIAGFISRILDGSVSLVLMFSVLIFLEWKVRKAIQGELVSGPPAAHIRGDRRTMWKVSVTAGLCAGFALLLYDGVASFWAQTVSRRIEEVLVFGLALLSLQLFLDPLIARIRGALHIPVEHGRGGENASRVIRIVTTVVVLTGTILHHFLADQMMVDPVATFILLGISVLIPGIITFAWARGARALTSRAAASGALTGALMGSGYILLVWVLLRGQIPFGNQMQAYSVDEMERIMLINGLGWGIPALAAGWALDRWKSGAPGRNVLIAIPVSLAVSTLIHALFPASVIPSYQPADFAKMLGWGLGILFHPAADRVFRAPAPSRAATALAPSPPAAAPEAAPPGGE